MIWVIGDVILDSYIFGEAERISPEAPVPVVKQYKRTVQLGGAANVANILASNNIDVAIISTVYDDAIGHQIIDLCKTAGIQTLISVITNNKGRTPHKSRIVANNQQICRIDDEIQAPISSYEIIKNLKKATEPNLCIISDYGKGTLKDLSPVLKYLLDNKIKILVDPKDSSIEKYDGVYLLKPNLIEFKKFLSTKKYILKNDSIEYLRDAAVSLIAQTKVENMLITLNRRGSLLVSRSGSNKYYTQEDVQVSDVTGAGDTVLAFLASSLIRENNLDRAVTRAMKAGIIAVQKFGTVPVLQRDLPVTNLQGESTQDEKLTAVKQMKLDGHKIIFANGCFDVLHIGHIDLLSKAKKLGGKLVVAINSDLSVRKLKGKARPLNTLKDRVKMLDALSFVDIVISFNEDTPLDLIKKIRPDVLIKGADYKATDVVGYDEVVSWGGKVEIISLTKGFSSSALIKKT